MNPKGHLVCTASTSHNFAFYSLLFYNMTHDPLDRRTPWMEGKPTGCPFHHSGWNFSVPESEKCLFKSTSYTLLSIIPWDSGYNPCKMKTNKHKTMNLKIKWNLNYVAIIAIILWLFYHRNRIHFLPHIVHQITSSELSVPCKFPFSFPLSSTTPLKADML